MPRRISLATLVVPDYDAAIAYYCGLLGFHLVEDAVQSAGKRWVVVSPSAEPGASGLLLAKAATVEQAARIGDQTGGRVAFFLATTEFAADFARMQAAGVQFEEQPRHEPYGRVAVFRDAFGNRWDLLEQL